MVRYGMGHWVIYLSTSRRVRGTSRTFVSGVPELLRDENERDKDMVKGHTIIQRNLQAAIL